MPRLSIVTLSLPSREHLLPRLRDRIGMDRFSLQSVEWVVVPSAYPGEPYGEKMRRARGLAKGDYVAYLDDDDSVSPDYLSQFLQALVVYPDVVTITAGVDGIASQGQWVFKANYPLMYHQGDHRDTLPANHYCAWRRDIAAKGVWLPYGYGSEVVYAETLNAGLPNLYEVHVNVPTYLYTYDLDVTHHQHPQDVGKWIGKYNGGLDVWKDADGNLYASEVGQYHVRTLEESLVVNAKGERVKWKDRPLTKVSCVTIR